MKPFPSILDDCAVEAPGRPFITCAQTTSSYGEVAELVRRLANGLSKLGIRKGDKVCLFLPNGLPFVLSMFAAGRLGSLFVPAHPQFTARELRYVLDHADAVAVIVDNERLPLVRDVRRECRLLRHVIVSDGPGGNDVLGLDDLLNSPAQHDIPNDVGADDAAAMLYTSGTTGQPKGAVLTHRGYMLNASAFAERVELDAADVVYCVLPLAHLNAQRSSLLPVVLARARLILAKRFSVTDFWPTVRANGVTFFSVIPTIVSLLLQQAPKPADREHRVRLCVTPITPSLRDAFEARFGIPVVNTYGLTEGMLNVMNFVDPQRRRPGAVGKPLLPEVHRIRIVDETDRDVPRGQAGEILLQSPAMTTGYYKNPAATAQLLRDNWLHTGDVGYLDDEGYLYFVGRKKEMIRRGGENVAPAEIEAVAAAHPHVQEAVAAGVPDPLREEEIKLCVILREDADETSVPPADLIALCKESLASFKIPRYIEYRTEFPRTPATLRVQRSKLTSVAPEAGVRLFDMVLDRWIDEAPTAP